MTSFTQDISWAIHPFIAPVDFFQDISWALGTTNETVSLVLEGAPSGLAGIVTVTVVSQDGLTIAYYPSAQNIVEFPEGTGRYVATIPLPAVGRYFVVWSDGVTTTEQTELLVLSDSVIQTPLRLTSYSAYRIKAGDTEPGLILTVRNAGGDPVDLDSVTGVDMTITRRGDTTPTVERSALVLDPVDEGQIALAWLDGETDVPGTYVAEAGLLWPGNGRSTAPSKAAYRFVIEGPGT